MRALLVAALAVQVLAGQDIRLAQVATGVSAPTDIQNAGDGSGRLFFVQQNGLIRMFRNGALAALPFSTSVPRRALIDGLAGTAFPPGSIQTASSELYGPQRQYGNCTLSRSATTRIGDAASETVLLNITQPFANHNGGQLRFDRRLFYIGMGDGGRGDPMRSGPPGTLPGKMLRIDVESEPEGCTFRRTILREPCGRAADLGDRR
jgi:hypothetical protein